MKTIELSIKQIIIASFLTILILGGNVSAKGTETRFASSLEKSLETELIIEDWMVNDNHWKIAEQSFYYVEPEKCLDVESWMTDENYWEPLYVRYLETAKDEELKIENWMIRGEFWKTQE